MRAARSRKAWVSDPQAWRSWPQAELDRAYNARGTVPDAEAEIRRYAGHSAPMYTTLPCLRGLAYGPGADERLDLFPVPGQPDAPLFLFIHGGYWRSLSREDSVFMARSFTAQGIAVAALDYSLAPAARLETMVDQCRRATAWLYREGPALGIGARQRFVVAGSSAGGHLAAMVLAHGWQAAQGVPADVVQAGMLVSGLFDLEPVRHAAPNAWLQLDAARVQGLSPQYHLPDPARRLQVVVAEHDTDEFKRQSRHFAMACIAQGNATTYHEVAARNHFDVILDWMDADSAMARTAAALLGSR